VTPEQKARQQIDRQLEQAGWIVQDYRQMHITAGLGVAVREFPLSTGYADYMLYADAKAIGSVEAEHPQASFRGQAGPTRPKGRTGQRAAGATAGESGARRSKRHGCNFKADSC